MRLFAATLATETNTFSPLPTSLEAYKESVFYRPGEHPEDAPRMCTAPLFVARQRAAADKFTLIEGSCFAASPAGTTNRADYEFMRDEILAQLQASMPVDGVLFGLHGAMVAYGYDDVEGDIIERARAIVGKGCVIGVELDPHCHLTLKRMRSSDIVVCYKEYPHTDVVERAEDVLDLVLGKLRGKINPVMSVYDCRQIQSYPTTEPLMRASSIASRRWRARTVSSRFPSSTAFRMPMCSRIPAGCWSSPTLTRPRRMRSQRVSARNSFPCAARPSRNFLKSPRALTPLSPATSHPSFWRSLQTTPAEVLPPTIRRSCAI